MIWMETGGEKGPVGMSWAQGDGWKWVWGVRTAWAQVEIGREKGLVGMSAGGVGAMGGEMGWKKARGYERAWMRGRVRTV